MFFFYGCCPHFPWLFNCEEEYRFTPLPITRLCPNQIGGDREFDGHGPEVRCSATLKLENSGKELWVTITLHAKETRSDWSEADGKWERKLETAPVGKKFVRIVSDTYSTAQYTDTNHRLDLPQVLGGSLVEKFEVMGDTGGNDIGNCTDDDVYLNVHFNEIVLIVKDT